MINSRSVKPWSEFPPRMRWWMLVLPQASVGSAEQIVRSLDVRNCRDRRHNPEHSLAAFVHLPLLPL